MRVSKLNDIQNGACSGSDPIFAATCPLCREEGINLKYSGFDLSDHLRTKHSKAALADFLSAEACYERFWD